MCDLLPRYRALPARKLPGSRRVEAGSHASQHLAVLCTILNGGRVTLQCCQIGTCRRAFEITTHSPQSA